jgi:hypothetical protein
VVQSQTFGNNAAQLYLQADAPNDDAPLKVALGVNQQKPKETLAGILSEIAELADLRRSA